MSLSEPANVFIKEKPALALLAIHKSYSEIYPSKVSKRIDSTYAHTVNIVSKMEENGILKSEKRGRKRILTLTDRGEAYSNALVNMVHIDSDKIDFPGSGESLDFLNGTKKNNDDSEEKGGSLAREL